MKTLSQYLLILLCTASFSSFSTNVSAEVIDFEDQARSCFEPNQPVPQNYKGFGWNSYAYTMMVSCVDPSFGGYPAGTIGNVNLYTAYARPISFQRILNVFQFSVFKPMISKFSVRSVRNCGA